MEKAFDIWKFQVISWLPPLGGAASADIESTYTFDVIGSNKINKFVLQSPVEEIWALKNKAKIA